MWISFKSQYSHCWLSLLKWDLFYCKYSIRDKNSVNKKLLLNLLIIRLVFCFYINWCLLSEKKSYNIPSFQRWLQQQGLSVLFCSSERIQRMIANSNPGCVFSAAHKVIFKLYNHSGFKGAAFKGNMTGVIFHNELWKTNREKIKEWIRCICHGSDPWVSTRHYLQVLSSVFNLFEVLNQILCACTGLLDFIKDKVMEKATDKKEKMSEN